MSKTKARKRLNLVFILLHLPIFYLVALFIFPDLLFGLFGEWLEAYYLILFAALFLPLTILYAVLFSMYMKSINRVGWVWGLLIFIAIPYSIYISYLLSFFIKPNET